MFILYLPAAEAGKAGDFYKDWVLPLRSRSFFDYVNSKGSPVLYQFTQLVTLVFYKVFGIMAWPWHLLHLTAHAVNGLLLFSFLKKLLQFSVIRNSNAIAFGTALLYCVCPHISEVVVHEPCFHYTLGFMLVLASLGWLQMFQIRQEKKYMWYIVLAFAISTFSLEVFYITPILGVLLVIYYRIVIHADRSALKKTVYYIIIPQLFLCVLHLVLLRLVTGAAIDHHVASSASEHIDNFRLKAPKYLFHILLLGRYWPHEVKMRVYELLSNTKGQAVLYGLTIIFYIIAVLRWRYLSARVHLIILFSLWVIICIIIVSPRWFSSDQLVVFDRYTYFMAPFIYVILLLIIGKTKYKAVSIGIFAGYTAMNIFFAVKVNRLWGASEKVITNLVKSFPHADNKIILLLNPPENMHGIPMIGSFKQSMFRIMYDMEQSRPINVPVYDVASYNLTSAGDGAHARVVNDSTVHVTLNQWGTWWWYHFQGAPSYENNVYKLNMVDGGHWYELVLKQPAKHYLLLFEVDAQWKIVNWNKKHEDQL